MGKGENFGLNFNKFEFWKRKRRKNCGLGTDPQKSEFSIYVQYFKKSFSYSTCVSSGIEIPLDLQCKILLYKILWQLPMEMKDLFSLCKIHHPAWIQVDHRNLILS